MSTTVAAQIHHELSANNNLFPRVQSSFHSPARKRSSPLRYQNSLPETFHDFASDSHHPHPNLPSLVNGAHSTAAGRRSSVDRENNNLHERRDSQLNAGASTSAAQVPNGGIYPGSVPTPRRRRSTLVPFQPLPIPFTDPLRRRRHFLTPLPGIAPFFVSLYCSIVRRYWGGISKSVTKNERWPHKHPLLPSSSHSLLSHRFVTVILFSMHRFSFSSLPYLQLLSHF